MSKRIITAIMAIALIATLVVSCFAFVGCKKDKTSEKRDANLEKLTPNFTADADTELSVGVLSDVHVMSQKQAVNLTCSDFKSLEARGQKMLGLSESILKTTVDDIIEKSDFDVILVCGDNTDDGGYDTHTEVAIQLQRLEDAGIKVFTIPGNHDLNNKSSSYATGSEMYVRNTSEKEFTEIYKNFGYNSTDAKEFYKDNGGEKNDTFELGDNLSYVADLSDDYTLIAIDMCNYVATGYLKDEDGSYAAKGYEVDSEGYVLIGGEKYPIVSGRHDGAMTEDLLLWVKAKIEETVNAGKTPIGMMHFPLLQHFGSLVGGNALVNDPEGYSVAEVLADAGMKYIFTGHIHIQDNDVYTSKNGNKIYDINSASLCNYPTPVRYAHFAEEKTYIRTWNINHISEKNMPDFLTDAEKDAITKDFAKYSLAYIDDSMLAKVKNKIEPKLMITLLKKFGIKANGTNDAQVEALATSLYEDVFLKFLKLPLYKKDAQNGELSVESICEKYDITLPKSNYKSVFNMAMSLVGNVYGGDEVVGEKDARKDLLKYSVYSALYIIADYDLFGKMHELNSEVPEIDIMCTMDDLFASGEWEICTNGFLTGVVKSLDIKVNFEISGKNIMDILSGSDACKALSTVKNASSIINGLLKEKLGIEGLDVGKYISVSTGMFRYGTINIGAILDENLYGELTLGLVNDALENSTFASANGIVDSAPSDITLVINRSDMSYVICK